MEVISIFTNNRISANASRPDTHWVRERVKPLLEKDLPYTHNAIWNIINNHFYAHLTSRYDANLRVRPFNHAPSPARR